MIVNEILFCVSTSYGACYLKPSKQHTHTFQLVLLLLLLFFFLIKDKDGFLLSGHFDVKDKDIISSSYRAKISLASFIAFGPHRSRRGSMGYATTSETKMSYGHYWSPEHPNMPDKYLQVSLFGFLS